MVDRTEAIQLLSKVDKRIIPISNSIAQSVIEIQKLTPCFLDKCDSTNQIVLDERVCNICRSILIEIHSKSPDEELINA